MNLTQPDLPHPRQAVVDVLRQARIACRPMLPEGDERFRELLADLAENRSSLETIMDLAQELIEEARFMHSLFRVAGSVAGDPHQAQAMILPLKNLDSKWDDLVRRLRIRAEFGVSELLANAMDRFAQATDLPLIDLLNAKAVSHRYLEPDAYEDHLLREIHGFLTMRVFESLQDLGPEAEQKVRAIFQEEQDSIARLLLEPYRLAASGFGSLPPLPKVRLDAGHGWEFPGFKGHIPDFQLDRGEIDLKGSMLGLLLPARFQHSWVVRRIRKALPRMSGRGKVTVRGVVAKYLDTCIQSLDTASRHLLGKLRQGVEHAILAADQDHLVGPHSPGVLDDLERAETALLALREITAGIEPPALTPPEPMSPIRVPLCLVCEKTWGSLYAFFTSLQGHLGGIPGKDQTLLSISGLCSAHAWFLERFASPMGLCASYPSLLDDLANRIQSLSGLAGASAQERMKDLLPGPDHCPACELISETELIYTEQIGRDLVVAGDRNVACAWPGLCLKHLSGVLGHVHGAMANALVSHQARLMASVAQTMRDHRLKSEARRWDLLTTEERLAPWAALELLAGARNLSRVKAEDHL